MTPQGYLKDRIQTCAHYTLSAEEKNYIKDEGLQSFLYKKITRREFRKWRLPEQANTIVTSALEYCIKNQKPIVFRFPFGGYKLWRFKTAPEVEWAEFFTIAHTLSYLAPIVAAYKTGIELMFSSDDVFVERLNNIPKSDTEAYYQSFKRLLECFSEHTPSNVKLTFFRHGDLFKTEKDFEEEFAFAVDKVKDTWRTKRSTEELEQQIKTSIMNIKWDGAEDLTGLSNEEKQKKIDQGVIYHDALMVMPSKDNFNKAPDKIHIFTEPFSKFVPIGSTKASIVRFWVGTGILEKKEDTYQERILSITQYESIKNEKYSEEKVDIVPLKNFKKVRVYSKSFNFSKK